LSDNRRNPPSTAQPRVATGGKLIYGARLGILMLEARFPRIVGDMGNAQTWPFPVLYRVVSGASPQRVVLERANGLRAAFLDAAKELVELGAEGITTNCGFLSIYQSDVAAHVRVPVATSSLMQAPLIECLLPTGQKVGILTIHAGMLSPQHLQAAGVRLDTPVVGTEGGREFTRAILGNEPRLDVAAAERDILEAGERLLEHQDIGAVVLECTNMAPYAGALSAHLRLPVYDIYSFITWFHAGLAPRNFGPPAGGA